MDINGYNYARIIKCEHGHYCHFNGEPWIFDLTGVGFSHILRQNQRNIKSSLDGRFSKQHGDFPMKWGFILSNNTCRHTNT